MRDIECNDPSHPSGVDHLDYHLLLGESLPTPDGKFDCWLHPRLDNGNSVQHRWRDLKWTDHMRLMRAIRSEEGIDPRWNILTVKQRKTFLDAALADGMNPEHLQDFTPVTYRLKARPRNRVVYES